MGAHDDREAREAEAVTKKPAKKLTPRQLNARREGRAFMKEARAWTEKQKKKNEQ